MARINCHVNWILHLHYLEILLLLLFIIIYYYTIYLFHSHRQPAIIFIWLMSYRLVHRQSASWQGYQICGKPSRFTPTIILYAILSPLFRYPFCWMQNGHRLTSSSADFVSFSVFRFGFLRLGLVLRFGCSRYTLGCASALYALVFSPCSREISRP